MDSKKIRKEISRYFGWLGLKICSLIIKHTPYRYLYRAAALISKGGYFIAKKQRKIALESLKIAFGREKSRAEIEGIARDCFTYMAKSGVELFFLLERIHLIRTRVAMEGRQNLDEALSRGKGVILVSAHFGNFPLMLCKLALEGYNVSGIMRPMRDSRVEKIFLEKRDSLGIKTIYSIPRIACVERCLTTLRKNEILFIPMDQNFGTAGVFVDFFGRKAATATGPVVLAQRTKAVILPCFMLRQPDDTHKIIFEKPLELIEGADPEQTILMSVQAVTSVIEDYIRRYPAEWGWIHRRWKSKPT